MSPLLIDFLRHIESELRYVEDKTADLDYEVPFNRIWISLIIEREQ